MAIALAVFCFVIPAQAAAPSGADTFQLLASPFTGGDNTGDGGTGSLSDLNYYYVGQTFTSTIEIVSGGTDAANVWIDHDTTEVTPSNLLDGSYFTSYAGQNTAGGQVRLTGFRTSGTSSGTGTFGTLDWTMVAPTAAAYGTGTPETLDIDVGVIGDSTESNISLGGVDILDDEEDFQFHVWADTEKPYALNPSPANAATGVAVTVNYLFDLRDSKNGEGDNSGVGTGVSTATPPGVITQDDGGGPASLTAFDAYSCSGTWGTNLCNVTVNPNSPSGIPGDTRNWEYATSYTIDISGFEDLASASQDQLGDTNGPNAMDAKSYTFTTEADAVPPQVVSEIPARTSAGNAVGTDITVVVHDKKAYPGTVSGTGVDSTTCKFNVSSPSFALTTFQEGDAEVTVSAVDYGFQFVIDPTSDFAQDETVTVSAYDCEDLATNVMVTDTWTFTTADSDPPFVDGQVPGDDDEIAADATLVLHVKDNGSGVDLGSVVIFVDGEFYTDGGGAGSVTTTGTDISFGSSLDFNGGNYVGDTTDVTGSPADYTFTIDPAADFSSGEAVPVIAYASDLDGNLMPQEVYAAVVETPGGGGGGRGGSNTPILPGRDIDDVRVSAIDEDSVLVAWRSSQEATGRVVYGDSSPLEVSGEPNYGYAASTETDGVFREYHSVVIDGLLTGIVYRFVPVNRDRGGASFTGPELRLATRPPVVFEACPDVASAPECPPSPVLSCPAAASATASAVKYVPVPSPVTRPAASGAAASGIVVRTQGASLERIERTAGGYAFDGLARPGSVVTIIIR